MSLVKFEVKEDHLKLMRFLQWSQTETNHILSINNLDNDDVEEVILTPFGGDDLIQDIGDIIYGVPEGKIDFMDEDSGFGKVTYSDEQVEYMTELFNGLTTALNICLYTQSFEIGHYKRRYHDIHWEKYEPKNKK
jgi:hypothetical protein